jgi:hypothetical protein
MSLRALLDRYEAQVSGDEQGFLGELVVALARDALAPRTDLDGLRAELDGTHALVARLVAGTPSHADLRQLASAVGALATRVAELESVGRTHDGDRAKHERWRVALLRVRRGDLVRCTTCEGLGCVDGARCPDCTDDAGNPLHGVAGLVPPLAQREAKEGGA